MADSETEKDFLEFMNGLVSCFVVTRFAQHLRIFNLEREANGKKSLEHIDAEILIASHPPVVHPPSDYEDISEYLNFKHRYLDADWEA